MKVKLHLNIFNPIHEYEDEAPRRSITLSPYWMNIEKRRHIPPAATFSALIGGDDGAYENFSEFVSEAGNPLPIITDKLTRETLLRALDDLSDEEYHLISAIYISGKSEREYAEETGMLPMTVHNRKVRILKKIKKHMDFEK